MEKIENEKIYKIILGVFTAISISISVIFCMFCIGLSKVDAKSYTWSSPEAISFSTSNDFNVGLLKTCTFTNQCDYNNGNYVSDYIQYRYPISENSSNNDTIIKPDKYEVAFRMRIVGLDNLTSENLRVRLFYYPNQNSNYGVATCDGGETTQIIYNNNTVEDVYVEYKCEVLNVVGNVSYLGVVIGSTPNTLFFTQVSQNLTLRGPELTEEDVINNNNANTDKVIQNQDINTDKVINNNNANTDKVIGAIEGDGLEDTTPINPNKKNELQEVEDGLLNEDITTSLNEINISIDSNSNEFIWNLVTRIINTNSMIFGLVLTMLSLGVLKLVLNR